MVDSQSSASPMRIAPKITSGLAPVLAIVRLAICAETTMTALTGRNANPAWIGLYPRISCTNCVRKKNMLNSAAPVASITT